MCLLEVVCFHEVDMNCLQTRLCELKNSQGAPVFPFLVDNTHIRSSFYTVYSQPDISDVSSSRKRSLRLVETAEIQASLHSPLFSRLVEDGDRRCDLIWASPVTLHFFPLCVLKRCPRPIPRPYISSPSLIYRRHLKVCLCDLLFFKTLFSS